MIYEKNKVSVINNIQLEIFKNTISAINRLGLSYFLVHGSLLGAVRLSKFIPFDDDIDIAMPRKDYEIFLEKAQQLLPAHLFVQSYKSEKKYPLSFAKVRNINTTYLSYKFVKCGINQGIYIDIFPIDYAKQNNNVLKLLFLKIADFRIGSIIKERKGFRRRILCCLSFLVFPFFKMAISFREKAFKNNKKEELVSITGGKKCEQSIPASWFNSSLDIAFCDCTCCAPINYKEYLTHIYGDYLKTTLLENRFNDLNSIEMNADIISVTTSYKDFLR